MCSVDNNKRNTTFDVAKGIGIILILATHAHCPFYKFICLFHVAIFFMISGYFLNEKYWSNYELLKEKIKKIFQTLYLPLFTVNTLFILIHNIFIKIGFYTTNEIFYNKLGFSSIWTIGDFIIRFIGGIVLYYIELMGGPLWFVKVLFIISLSFCIVSFFLSNIIRKHVEFIRGLICILCLIIGFIMYKLHFNFYAIGTIFSCVILFYLGFLYKKVEKYIALNIYSLLISLFCLLICNFYNTEKFFIGINYYNNPFWLIFASISGFIFILSISLVIEKVKIFNKILIYIGQNTMPILCLHFLLYKIVTFIEILVYNSPSYNLASFPYYLVGYGGFYIFWLV